MMTGIHTVRDIRCNQCLELLGWKYVGSWALALKRRGVKFVLNYSLPLSLTNVKLLRLQLELLCRLGSLAAI